MDQCISVHKLQPSHQLHTDRHTEHSETSPPAPVSPAHSRKHTHTHKSAAVQTLITDRKCIITAHLSYQHHYITTAAKRVSLLWFIKCCLTFISCSINQTIIKITVTESRSQHGFLINCDKKHHTEVIALFGWKRRHICCKQCDSLSF